MDDSAKRPVLILGAGINGCAAARDLALNGVPVWLVERRDISAGATSKSSRLIHGGLRYLEYGDVRLVRESLRERDRLLELAPHMVRPLRLWIPGRHRLRGMLRAAVSFAGLSRTRLGRRIPARGRGLLSVRIGLWIYDLLAFGSKLPRSAFRRAAGKGLPAIDRRRFRWACGFYDAQILYPERFVLELLADARRLAADSEIDFQLWTYARVELDGDEAVIHSTHGGRDDEVARCTPAAIVNATGAWGDLTLGELHVKRPPLFGGTKGSHFISFSPPLRDALRMDGVYAEADDGRLVFVLPFGEGVLVGTTDQPFDDRPERAVATEAELDYLLTMVNEVLDLKFTHDDVAQHYAGVRPLPRAPESKPGAVSRDHGIDEEQVAGLPLLTLIGGKLTTCREFAEQVSDRLLAHLGRRRVASTRRRALPGGEDYPASQAALEAAWRRLSQSLGLNISQVRAVWQLVGTRTESILSELQPLDSKNLAGTEIPLGFARWVIDNEAATTLDDLIARRLMLLYHPRLSEKCLRDLANLLVEAGRMNAEDAETAIAATIEALARDYGKRVNLGA